MIKKSVHIDLQYTEFPYWERYAAAKKDGFDYVEFYIEGWEDKDLDKVRKALEDNDLAISAATGATPYSMCDPLQKDDYIVHIRKLIAACGKIDCHMLMCHSDLLDPETGYKAKVLPHDYSFTTKICAMFDVLRTIEPMAREADVVITLEPLSHLAHEGYFLHDMKTAVDLIRAVNSPYIKVLFDCYHTYIEEGNISVSLEKYYDAIGHVHIADSPGRHEPLTGDINYRGILKTLDRLGYDKFVAFEFYPAESTEKAMEAVKLVCDGIC